jgi:hypothetical protein
MECSHGWSEAEPVDASFNITVPEGQRGLEGRKGHHTSSAPPGQVHPHAHSTGSASPHPWLHSVALRAKACMRCQ